LKINDLTIVVACNKKDYFFARLCVASIRYYYPAISIELIKDPGNGKFNSTELEKHFRVKSVDLRVERIGWGAAKLLYLYKSPPGKKILFLDADIVFTGPFLERLLPLAATNDFVVSAEYNDDPYAEWVKKIYFDTKQIEQTFPGYQFPGYFFNTGQIIMTTGAIQEKILEQFFDINAYPFWKKAEIFPLVDQSLFNYLLPTLASQQLIKLGVSDFMIWSRSRAAQKLTVAEVATKEFKGGLIHWAGDGRTPQLHNMTNFQILHFFETLYYDQISFGKMKMVTRKVAPFIITGLKKIRRLVKR
jgi:hypothetical protein